MNRSIRAELLRAQIDYSRVVSDISGSDSSYAKLLSASTLSYRDVTSRLAGDEVLLEYLLGDSVCTVFVLTRDKLASLSLPVTRDELKDLISFSRRAVAMPPSPGAVPLWKPPLRRLYHDLISPIESRGLITGKHRLIIVPHGELHFISFASLIRAGPKEQFLVERFDMEYAPSATAWVRLASRTARPLSDRVLAMAPNVDRLPASRAEVDAIARIYGRRAIVQTGANASIRYLRQNISNVSTLHLATFGVLNKRNPLFSFVRLAPTRDDDGRLEVNEVFNLGLNGQTVVLSACQTALGWGANGDVPAGDDWIGLVQSFLAGGARSVVATLWPVDDRATSTLMKAFHTHRNAGESVTASIASAQREMIRNGPAAPFYWAAFVANGR